MRFKRRRKEENTDNERGNVLLESRAKPLPGNKLVLGNLDLDRTL